MGTGEKQPKKIMDYDEFGSLEEIPFQDQQSGGDLNVFASTGNSSGGSGGGSGG